MLANKKVRGRVLLLQIFGNGGLPSGEGIIVVAPEEPLMPNFGLRLGGPGENCAGPVSAAQFTNRAQMLVQLYCSNKSALFEFADVGGSLPDIVCIDGF